MKTQKKRILIIIRKRKIKIINQSSQKQDKFANFILTVHVKKEINVLIPTTLNKYIKKNYANFILVGNAPKVQNVCTRMI